MTDKQKEKKGKILKNIYLKINSSIVKINIVMLELIKLMIIVNKY